MNFFHCVALSFGCMPLIWRSIYCTPTLPVYSSRLDSGCSSLFSDLANPFKHSNSSAPGSLPAKYTHRGSINRAGWRINDDLRLELTICGWEPDPVTIHAVLVKALDTVGKKPAAGLLDRKFTQRSNNRYNTLLFEISPRFTNYQLTWGDVGEAVGENGLLDFYETTQQWNTVYFTLVDATRGRLGQGAVRRWWQLEAPRSMNETVSQSSLVAS